MIVWHVLADNTTYTELGADYFDKRNDTAARQRYLIRELEDSATPSPSRPPPDHNEHL